MIGEDRRVYEGRGWNKVGAHTFGWNKVSVSFAFMGNFHDKEADPLAIVALKGIISYGVSQGLLSTDYKMYGHRDARPTIGPGDKLYSQIQTFDHFDHNKPVKPTNKTSSFIYVVFMQYAYSCIILKELMYIDRFRTF